MIVVELTAAIDAAGATKTFYLSTDPFVTTPSDTPANTEFLAVLVNPGSFGTSVFTDGRTGGGATLQNGEMIVSNMDGSFDPWQFYSFDGRQITVRMGEPSGGYPGSMVTLFKGTVEAVELTWDSVVIRVMDLQRSLQVPLLPNTYGGTNSLPNGIDGTANDIKGQKKPRVYGLVYNIQPQAVNTSLLIYQVSDRAVQAIDAVYDRGVALAQGSDFATNALLQAATGLSAGTYYTCKAEGLFRLASTPAGYPTADVTEGASASLRTPAQVLSRMATDAGLTTVSSDITSLDNLTSTSGTSWECGVYVTDDVTFEDAMNQVSTGFMVAYYFDALGRYRMGMLVAPSGIPSLYITEDVVLPGIERVTPPEMAVPPWAVIFKHTKIWTVQDTDLAGSVSAASRAFLADEYRTVRSEDAAVKTKYLLAQEYEVYSLMADRSNSGWAATQGARVRDLLKGAPNMFRVPVPLDIIQGASYKMLDVVSLTISRFSMSGGKLFLLLGIDLELADNTAILTLWG
jgi:hypothetical protein